MNYKELLRKLMSCEGPCMRLCAYCPEEFGIREVRECIEWLVENMYSLQQDKDELLKQNMEILMAYKEATGFDYHDRKSLRLQRSYNSDAESDEQLGKE